MNEQSNNPEERKRRAAELYCEARGLYAEGEYSRARACYERSLALVEDEEVRAAYLKLLSAIGPM